MLLLLAKVLLGFFLAIRHRMSPFEQLVVRVPCEKIFLVSRRPRGLLLGCQTTLKHCGLSPEELSGLVFVIGKIALVADLVIVRGLLRHLNRLPAVELLLVRARRNHIRNFF